MKVDVYSICFQSLSHEGIYNEVIFWIEFLGLLYSLLPYCLCPSYLLMYANLLPSGTIDLLRGGMMTTI